MNNESNLNDNIENNSTKNNQLSFDRDKTDSTTIGIPTDNNTREIFKGLPGADNHQKLVTIMKAFEEKVAREKGLAFVDNVDLINKCIDTIATQVKSISQGLATEEARMRSEYIDDTRAQLYEVKDSHGTITELTDKNEKLAENNEKLNSTVEDLRVDIVSLNKDIADLNKIKNELINENNELLKNQNTYKDSLNALKETYESKIEEFVSKVSELRDQLSISSTKLHQLQEDNKKLETKISDITSKHESEIDNLRVKLHNEEINSVKKDADITSLKKELEQALEANKKDKELNENILKDKDENIKALEEDMNVLISTNDSNKNLIKSYKAEIEDSKKNINKLSAEIKSKDDEIADTNKNYKQVSSELEKITLQLKSSQLESNTYKMQSDTNVRKLKESETVLCETRNKLADEEKRSFKLEFELNSIKEKYEALIKKQQNK